MDRTPEAALPHPCKGCGQCCKHIALQIDTPEEAEDYDNIYWYLLHENIRVYIDDEEDWMLEVTTRCRHLTSDLRCGEYEQRPALCEEYDPQECVKSDPSASEQRAFDDAASFLAYLKEIGVAYEPRAEAARRKKKAEAE